MTAVKICGLKDVESLKAAADAGAKFVGFVFYPRSSRYITADSAFQLVRNIPGGVRAVGLFVDPLNAELDHILKTVKLDMLQLHGNETPDRIAAIKDKYGVPVMKAIRVGGAEDLRHIASFEAISDWLLFDAKVEGKHGGTGKTFDWNLLKDIRLEKPWMLSGGLSTRNIRDALGILQPDAVDVSSGVEDAPGHKDPAKIRAFIETVKNVA